MKTISIVSFVTALLLGSFIDLVAQEERDIVPGARIRVTAPNVAKLVGTVVTFEAYTLVLKAEGQATPLAVPLASLKKLEVSRGQKSRVGKGAGIGFLVGAGLGAIAGAVALVRSGKKYRWKKSA